MTFSRKISVALNQIIHARICIHGEMGVFYYTGGMNGAFCVISDILSKTAVNFNSMP